MDDAEGLEQCMKLGKPCTVRTDGYVAHGGGTVLSTQWTPGGMLSTYYILNFNGVEAMVASLNTKFSTEFNQQVFAPYKVNGLLAGQFKNAGTFSYVRIYGAGHEVPAYKNGTLAVGEATFQFFTQTMLNQSLSSTWSTPPPPNASPAPGSGDADAGVGAGGAVLAPVYMQMLVQMQYPYSCPSASPPSQGSSGSAPLGQGYTYAYPYSSSASPIAMPAPIPTESLPPASAARCTCHCKLAMHTRTRTRTRAHTEVSTNTRAGLGNWLVALFSESSAGIATRTGPPA
ncbi:hypothetical protein B0H11DRAFT_2287382 [Mycena galericulata]|nr:hypothetical protein B0H11DRAFT_2287382 [Mycena galericulata]